MTFNPQVIRSNITAANPVGADNLAINAYKDLGNLLAKNTKADIAREAQNNANLRSRLQIEQRNTAVQDKLAREAAKKKATSDILTSDVQIGTAATPLDQAQVNVQQELSNNIDLLYAPGQKAFDASYNKSIAEAGGNITPEIKAQAIKDANLIQLNINNAAGLTPGAITDTLEGSALLESISTPSARQISDTRISRAADAADLDALNILKAKAELIPAAGTNSKAAQRAELEKFKAGSSLLRAQFNAQKGLGSGTKGKKAFISIGKVRLAGVEASNLVDNEYWFGHRDEAERVLAAAVIMGLDDKQQLALLNQGNPANKNITDFRDRFDSKLVEGFLGEDRALALKGYQEGTLTYDQFIADIKKANGGSLEQTNSNVQRYIDETDIKQKALEDRLQQSLVGPDTSTRLNSVSDQLKARLQSQFGPKPQKKVPKKPPTKPVEDSDTTSLQGSLIPAETTFREELATKSIAPNGPTPEQRKRINNRYGARARADFGTPFTAP